MSKGTMQRIAILGRLGRDPEMKSKQGDIGVVALNVATCERIKFRDKDQWEDITTWHHVTVFGQKADFCCTYLKKGDSVYLEGKLRPRKWVDKAGIDRYSIDIIAQEIQHAGKIERLHSEQTTAEITDQLAEIA